MFYRALFIWSIFGLLTAWPAGTAGGQAVASPDSLTAALSHARSDTSRAATLLALAQAYRSGDVTKQFSYANSALALAEKARWTKGEMHAEEVLGECYIKVQAYGDAILHFRRSIAASKKAARPDIERMCLQYLVHCHHRLNQLEAATDCQQRLLDLTARTGDRTAECNQMSAYAQRLADLNRPAEAIAWMERAVVIAEKYLEGVPRSDMVADLLNTEATIYARTDSTDQALACLRKAAALAAETENTSLSAYIISSFCDVYAAAGARDSAIYYARKTIASGEALGNTDLQLQYARLLSRLYDEAHQPAAALRYYKQYDSLSRITANTQQTIDQAMQVARINMEQQAAMNRLEKQSMEADRKTHRAALTAALTAVLALIVGTVVIYRSLRQKQRSNRIISRQAASLQQQNGIIDAALKAKELMLTETHHRIKNNLQLISSLLELQVAGLDDEHARHALRTAQRRVQSIATVHSQLYGSGENDLIGLSGFVQDLLDRLTHALGDDAVRFTTDIPPVRLPLHTVVLLGLILNELITNTFKHACAHTADPAAWIALTVSDDLHTLEYLDNGPELPRGRFDEPSGSLGLYLVRRMSLQLKGTANYIYDGRNRFTVRFRAGR